MTEQDLLHRAATCYRRAGHLDDAARCYRGAAMHREAAAVWESLGALAEAATDLTEAGQPERAAWLLVHHLGAAEPARELLRRQPTTPAPGEPTGATGEQAAEHRRDLLRALILARCDVADHGGNASTSTLAALDRVMDDLQGPAPAALDNLVEDWAVELAETVQRPDLVALVFAAAVRGRRHGAARRWDAWSLRTLGVPLVLPATAEEGRG